MPRAKILSQSLPVVEVQVVARCIWVAREDVEAIGRGAPHHRWAVSAIWLRATWAQGAPTVRLAVVEVHIVLPHVVKVVAAEDEEAFKAKAYSRDGCTHKPLQFHRTGK